MIYPSHDLPPLTCYLYLSLLFGDDVTIINPVEGKVSCFVAGELLYMYIMTVFVYPERRERGEGEKAILDDDL